MKKTSRIQIMWWLIICCVQWLGAQGSVVRRFGEDRLMLPRQICLAGDEVYVLDEYSSMTRGDEKIEVFTLDGDFKMEFGRGGAGPGEFGGAIAIYAVSGKIYILDSFRRQFHIFSQKDKKFIESKRILSGNAREPFTTPSDFLVTDDEQVYFNTARFYQGQKLIAKLIPVSSFQLKVGKAFLDCIPLYKNLKEMRRLSPAKRDKPDTIRNSYLNKGYIANVGNKIYFTYWLLNKVYEFSMTGELLNQYTLPVQSIDKTVAIKKVGIFFTLDHKLNYSLISDKNRLYVMSRDTNGDTLIFQLVNGQFTEICRINEMLFGGAISGNRLFAIGGDQSEIVICEMNIK